MTAPNGSKNNASRIVKPGLIGAVVTAGALAGTMDILAASLTYFIRTGKSPMDVLAYIATAVYGVEALSGNGWIYFTGLLFHYCIAYGWSFIFFVFYPKMALLRKNRIASSVSYGLLVWCAMNLIVLPMTRIQVPPFDPFRALIGAAILIVCIGLPLSVLAHRFYSRK